MSLTYYPKSSQAKGEFNGGEILENKPVGFSQDAGKLKPYSNLFYWAHAWSDTGSLLGEHPHQGFEILSFVLQGEIEHYDSKMNGWKKLKAGDAQIIRAGKGITHAEKFGPGSHIFQIWFDPNLQKTLSQPASYNDHASEHFPVETKNGITFKTYAGLNAPLKMDTPDVLIQEISWTKGTHVLKLCGNKIHSVYLIEGLIEMGEYKMAADDFVKIQKEEEVNITVIKDSRIFMIATPEKPGYPTYAEKR